MRWSGEVITSISVMTRVKFGVGGVMKEVSGKNIGFCCMFESGARGKSAHQHHPEQSGKCENNKRVYRNSMKLTC
jgi:hypothetical protein